MRIAINTRFLLKGRLEGIGHFTREVAQRLVAAHPEHEFLFLFDRPWHPDFVMGPNVEPVQLFPPARHPLLFMAWFEWAVPRALRRWGADVFLSPDNFCSLRTPIPTVLVIHDLAYRHFPKQVPWAHRQYYRHFMPRFARRADRIVTVSAYTRQDVLQAYGIAPERVAVACNGCRPFFRPLSEKEKQAVRDRYADGKPYFLFVGAVHPRKNVHRLIEAWDRFRKMTGAPVKLLIGGRFAWQTGPVRTAWEQAIHRDDIVFLGYLDEDELPAITGAALGLTYTSLFEGFGVPLLEAMHCDVPIIASNVSSMPEVAGPAALLVDPTDVEAIARAMARLWQDDALRARLVAHGRMQRQKFTWDRAAEVVWQQIEAVARQG